MSSGFACESVTSPVCWTIRVHGRGDVNLGIGDQSVCQRLGENGTYYLCIDVSSCFCKNLAAFWGKIHISFQRQAKEDCT